MLIFSFLIHPSLILNLLLYLHPSFSYLNLLLFLPLPILLSFLIFFSLFTHPSLILNLLQPFLLTFSLHTNFVNPLFSYFFLINLLTYRYRLSSFLLKLKSSNRYFIPDPPPLPTIFATCFWTFLHCFNVKRTEMINFPVLSTNPTAYYIQCILYSTITWSDLAPHVCVVWWFVRNWRVPTDFINIYTRNRNRCRSGVFFRGND